MNFTGSVTISGSDGSALVALTGNAFASSHLSMFQSLTAELASSGLASLTGSANLLLFTNNAGNVAAIGGAASGAATIVVGDSTNLSYIGTGASVQIVGGNGNDQVVTGNGNDTIALGTGQDAVYLGAGNSVVYAQGPDLIQVGSGLDTINVSGSGSTIEGGYGAPGSGGLSIVTASGTSTTINVINNATVTAGSGSNQTVNAYGDTTIDGAAGSLVGYNQINGSLKFVGLGGNILFDGGAAAGNDTLYGASGATIVVTGSAHDNVFVANDPQANGGNVVFNGSAATGGNEFWAGSGNATLLGGTGGDTLVGGAGQATLVGGIGSSANAFDIFTQDSGSGTSLTIENFDAVSGNRLTLFGFGASAAATAIANATSTNFGTTMRLTNGAQITLVGVQKSTLNTTNVISTT